MRYKVTKKSVINLNPNRKPILDEFEGYLLEGVPRPDKSMNFETDTGHIRTSRVKKIDWTGGGFKVSTENTVYEMEIV